MQILAVAHQHLGSFRTGSSGQFKGERKLLALFEDLVTNESEWLGDILSLGYNFNLLDGLCVYIGTLAYIMRNRGDLVMVGRILTTYTRLIVRYKEIVYTPGLVQSCTSGDLGPIIKNCDNLEHKYHWVCFPSAMLLISRTPILHPEQSSEKQSSPTTVHCFAMRSSTATCTSRKRKPYCRCNSR